MPLPPDALATAARHLKEGRVDAAADLLHAVVAERPGSAEAWHLLSRVATVRNRPETAAEALRRALALDNGRATWWFDLGNAMKSALRYDSAVEAYQRALRMQDSPDFRYNLANTYKAMGRLDEAAREYRRCVASRPDFAEAHTNLGNTLQALGKFEEAVAAWKLALIARPDLPPAIACFTNGLAEKGRIAEAEPVLRRCVTSRPNSVDAWFSLGRVLRETGRPEEAIHAFEQAIRVQPKHPESWHGLGNAKKQLGRVDEALAAWKMASERGPHPGALYNLGNALHELGRTDEAIEAFRSAVAAAPGRADAWNNLGSALRDRGRTSEAEEALRRAVSVQPGLVQAWHNLGNLLRFSNRVAEAVECWEKALSLAPDHVEALTGLVQGRQVLCDWRDLDVLTQRVLAHVDAGKPVLPLAVSYLPATEAQIGKAAASWARQLWRPAQRLPSMERGPRERLTIGYLSGDLGEHAVGYLVAGLFAKHDRSRVAVNVYSFGADGGPTRARIQSGCDVFRDVRTRSYAEAAQQIRDDGVDVLVDLNGWTGNPRASILAYRPAPVQVAWLGWPGPIGSAELVDWTLADPVVAPDDTSYAERVWRLPGAYQVNDDQRAVAPDVPSRAELGLPEGAFVFACMNGPQKLAPAQLDRWARLLKAVPDSVLWLLAPYAGIADNLRREAEARGIPASRLVFAGGVPVASHLARLQRADLFLDTLPYNAHTTCSDALWVGLPVVTLTGDTFAGRVATSLLRAAGLPDLVTATPEAYEALAVRLATDRAFYDAVRERTRAARTSDLFDTAAFARKLEDAYWGMWKA